MSSLLAPLRRLLAALAGSLAASLLAGALSGAAQQPAHRAAAARLEAALLAPLAVPLFLALAPVALWASAERVASLWTALRTPEERARERVALLLLSPPLFVLWVAAQAAAGRVFMTAFHNVGLAAMAQSVTLAGLALALLAGTVLSARRLGRRLPATAHKPAWFLLAPSVGLLLAAGLLALGVRRGDVQGAGGGILGTFGVLKKPELDLSPVFTLASALGLGALFTALFARRAWVGALALLASLAGAGSLLRDAARHYQDNPAGVALEARPGVARIVLRMLRRRTDRDRDGHSALFGGGDCDDRDPRRHPDARDLPGNGVDEDCSGADTPLPPPLPPPVAPPSLAERLRRETPDGMNLLFITVDTLRWDLHYAGNPRPLSPRMDALAARSVVFDRAYALSSYTGRAVAPLMAGRYPTEMHRGSEHFVSYSPRNILLPERLVSAGFHTFGAASHFYFDPRFGLTQGMQRWDTDAIPSGSRQESEAADHRVAERALRLLREESARPGRWLCWVHFFDPHKQYVPHPEFASFGDSERARYDAEVAWTDRQVGRLLDALEELHLAQSTVVVLTADHGEAFGEHGMSWHGVELWEELVRVPLIVYVPGLAARHVPVPRSQIDLVPTLLETLRLPAPEPAAEDSLSGASLVPDLLGEPTPERPIYIDLPEGPVNAMRRSLVYQGYKLTERGTRRFELYNLTADPGERTDLARAEPEQLARMRTLYDQLRARLHEVPAR